VAAATGVVTIVTGAVVSTGVETGVEEEGVAEVCGELLLTHPPRNRHTMRRDTTHDPRYRLFLFMAVRSI